MSLSEVLKEIQPLCKRLNIRVVLFFLISKTRNYKDGLKYMKTVKIVLRTQTSSIKREGKYVNTGHGHLGGTLEKRLKSVWSFPNLILTPSR